MEALAGLLLALVAPVLPNGHLLLAQLQVPEVRRSLPVDALTPVTPRLYVVFHDRSGWPMAFYLPADAGARAEVPAAALGLLAKGPGIERLLPHLAVPRLFLYAPYYRDLGPAVDLPLDVADYYFNALLEAYLDLGLDADSQQLFAARAEALLPGVPAEQRGVVYREALAQLGSHAFSAAVELRRALERLRAAGKDPCLAVDRRMTLFGLWGRIFTELEYRGQYRPEGTASWVLAPPLAPEDKRLFFERVLHGFWSGDVRRDFALDCPPAGRER